tara:strand:- start:675 stop:842 length:168 start_codon:yes stop_codon:yes gene_type:complete
VEIPLGLLKLAGLEGNVVVVPFTLWYPAVLINVTESPTLIVKLDGENVIPTVFII